jgi:hypothetical protein
MSVSQDGAPRVLMLSRNYPNSIFPVLGLWAESLARLTSRGCPRQRDFAGFKVGWHKVSFSSFPK